MDFPLPPVGEGLFEVELVRWLVQPGEAVHRGQPLAELMSDKATMELPAPFAGTVSATLAEAGAKVKVGQVILRYDPAARPESPSWTGRSPRSPPRRCGIWPASWASIWARSAAPGRPAASCSTT